MATLTGLNTQQGQDREAGRVNGQPLLDNPPIKNIRPITFGEAQQMMWSPRGIKNLTTIELPEDYGESRFDKRAWAPSQLNDLNELRAQEQTGAEKLFNGIAKGAVLFGTTFLTGVAELPVALAASLERGDWSGMWGNAITQMAYDVSQAVENVLPNYYTNREQTDPWYQHIWSANFIGDKFLKNLGFTAGAIASSAVTNNWMGALKIPQVMATILRSQKAGRFASAAIGSALQAYTESSIEAKQGMEDFVKTKGQLLDAEHERRLQEIEMMFPLQGENVVNVNTDKQALIDEENQAYANAKTRLAMDSSKVGNFVLRNEMPLLFASSLFQFGRMYANGFGTARHINNAVRKSATEYGLRNIPGAGLAKGVGNAFMEGSEEFNQAMIQNIAANYYKEDVDNFYNASLDPTLTENTVDFMRSAGRSISETWNDSSAWEEGFIGALTGGLGMVRIGKNAQNADVKLGKIGLDGGIIGDIAQARKERVRQQNIIDQVNSILGSKKISAMVRGANRNQMEQNRMDFAAMQGDAKTFKDAEFSQMISDIITIDQVDGLQDYKAMISSVLSDEALSDPKYLQDLVQSTEKDVNGKKEGPFTGMDNAEIVERLKKTRETLLDAVDKYKKIKDKIDINTEGVFSEEQLGTLTWMRAKLANWDERQKTMTGELVEDLKKLKAIADEKHLKIPELVVKEINKVNAAQIAADLLDASFSEKGIETVPLSGTLDDLINTLNNIKTRAGSFFDADVDVNNNVKVHNALADWLSSINFVFGEDTDVDFKDVIQKMNDLAAIHRDMINYNMKLAEYLENPGRLSEDMAKQEKKAAKKQRKKENKKTVDAYNNADTQEDKDEVYDNADDSGKAAIDKDHENDAEYQFDKHKKEFRDAIAKSIDEQDDIDDSIKAAAKEAYDTVVENTNTSNSDNLYYPYRALAEYREPLRTDISLNGDDNAVAEFDTQNNWVDFVIDRAIHKIYDSNNFKDSFRTYEAPASAVQPTREDVYVRMNDPAEQAPATKLGTDLPENELDTPIAPISSESLKEANEVPPTTTEQNPGNNGDKKRTLMNTIPYYDPEAKEKHDYRPFWEVDMERELQGLRMSDEAVKTYIDNIKSTGWKHIPPTETPEYIATITPTEENINNGSYRGYYDIWNFLEEHGAFRYVDQGLLEHGDNIQFAKVPSISDDVLFFVKKLNDDSFQIIGVVSARNDVVGIQELRNILKNSKSSNIGIQYKTNDGSVSTEKRNEVVDVYDVETTVMDIYNGNVPIIDEERSLKDIPNGRDAKIAVIKNGTFTGQDIEGLPIEPVNTTKMEGYIVALVPTAANTYFPVTLRTAPVSQTLFTDDNEFAKEIQETVKELNKATTVSEARKAVSKLRTLLYLNDDLDFKYYSKDSKGAYHEISNDGDNIYAIGFASRSEDIKNQQIFNENKNLPEDQRQKIESTVVRIDIVDHDDISLSSLQDRILNNVVYYNVTPRNLNDPKYNNKLINSDILTTNVESLEVRSSWFGANYYDPNTKKFVQAVRFPSPVRGQATPVGGVNNENLKVVIEGKNNKGTDITWYVDETNGKRIYYKKSADSKDFKLINDNKAVNELNNILYIKRRFIPQEVERFKTGDKIDRAGLLKRYSNYIYFQDKNDNNVFYDYYVYPKFGNDYGIFRIDLNNPDNISLIRRQNDSFVYESVLQQYLAKRYIPKQEAAREVAKPTVGVSKDIGTSLTETWNGRVDIDKTEDADNVLKSLNIDINPKPTILYWYSKKDIVTKTKGFKLPGKDLFVVFDDKTNFVTNEKQSGDLNVASYRIISKNGYSIHKQKVNEGKVKITPTSIEYVLKRISETIPENQEKTLNGYEGLNKIVQTVTPLPTETEQYTKVKDVLKTNSERFKNEKGEVNRTAGQYQTKEGELYLRFHALSDNGNGSFETPSDKVESASATKSIKRGVAFDTFMREYLSSKDFDKAKVELGKLVSADKDYTLSDEELNNIKTFVEEQLKDYNVISKDLIVSGTFNNLRIAGEMDCILEKDGRFYIVDFKASKNDPSKDAFYKTQLAFYKEALRQTFSENNINDVPIETLGFIWLSSTSKNVSLKTTGDLALNQQVLGPWAVTKDGVTQSVADTYNWDARINEKYNIEADNNTGTVIKTESDDEGIDFDDDTDSGMFNLNNMPNSSNERNKLVSDESSYTAADIDREVEWINQVLPQLSRNEQLIIVDGLIKASEYGANAYGQLKNNVIKLSRQGVRGIGFHEVFHYMFNLVLSREEQNEIFKEASKKWNNITNPIDLEEKLADAFQDYAIDQVYGGRGILPAMKRFFNKLLLWIKHGKTIVQQMDNLYKDLNAGRYIDAEEHPFEGVRYQEYTFEMQQIKDQAIADGTFMKTPNGKPTNLNERQWLQVRTKAFKDWFGDWTKIAFDKDGKVLNIPDDVSKVVDENGEPLVVYHATRNMFTEFNTEHRNWDSKITNRYGKNGMFFDKSESKARWWVDYETEIGEDPTIISMPVFLNIKNPDYTTGYDEFSARLNYVSNPDGVFVTKLTDDFYKGETHFEKYIPLRNRKFKYARLTGELVVFNPNQIKSATDNIGTFDPNNPDIRYSLVDDVDHVGRPLTPKAYQPMIDNMVNNLQYGTDTNIDNQWGLFVDDYFRKFGIVITGHKVRGKYKVDSVTRGFVAPEATSVQNEDGTIKSLKELKNSSEFRNDWNNLTEWQQTALENSGMNEEFWITLPNDIRDNILHCL